MGAHGAIAVSDNVLRMRGQAPRKGKPVHAVRGIPTPPAWLAPEAKAEWKRITPELDRLGLLSQLDRAALSIYCQTWAEWVKAAKGYVAEAVAIEGDHNPETLKKNPKWTAYLQAATLLQTQLKALALTPADRLRMRLPEGDDEKSELLD